MPDHRPMAEDAEPGTCPIRMSDLLPCERPVLNPKLDEDEFPVCLMHSRDNNKPISEFKSEIRNIFDNRSTAHRPQNAYDLTRFVFPYFFNTPSHCDKLTHFEGAEFLSGASLFGTVFSKGANFSFSVFKNLALFSNTSFMNGVNCHYTHFDCPFDCTGSHFHKFADFNKVTFSNVVNFSHTAFCLGVSFNGSRFQGRTYFDKTTIGPGKEIFWPPVADFRNVFFDEPHKVNFFQVNKTLGEGARFRFLNTPLEDIQFVDVEWDFRYGRLTLEDEYEIKRSLTINEPKWENLHLVSLAYRQLITNFERVHSYGLAEDCFVGSMEMRRLYPKYFLFYKFKPIQNLYEHSEIARSIGGFLSVTNLYRLASNYGSNYVRAVVVLFGLLGFFGIIYSLPGFGLTPTSDMAFLEGPYLESGYSLQRFIDGLLYAFEVITFTREPTFTVTNYLGKAVRIAETILIPGQLALFFLALRRRFRR